MYANSKLSVGNLSNNPAMLFQGSSEFVGELPSLEGESPICRFQTMEHGVCAALQYIFELYTRFNYRTVESICHIYFANSELQETSPYLILRYVNMRSFRHIEMSTILQLDELCYCIVPALCYVLSQVFVSNEDIRNVVSLFKLSYLNPDFLY